MFLSRFLVRLVKAGLEEDAGRALTAAAFGGKDFTELLATFPQRPGAVETAEAIEFVADRYFDARRWSSMPSVIGGVLQHADDIGIGREKAGDWVAVGFGYRDFAHLRAHYEPPFVAKARDYPAFAAAHREALGYWPLSDLLAGFIFRGHCLVLGASGSGRSVAIQSEIHSAPAILRRVLIIGDRDLPQLHDDLVAAACLEEATSSTAEVVHLRAAPAGGCAELASSIARLAASGVGGCVLLRPEELLAGALEDQILALMNDASSQGVALTFVATIPYGEHPALPILWRECAHRILFPGEYDAAFPGWELGRLDQRYPGIRAALNDRLFLRMRKGEPVPIQVEDVREGAIIGGAYPWLQSVCAASPAVDVPEEFLGAQWEGEPGASPVSIRMRRVGDVDTLEYDATLRLSEWQMVRQVAASEPLSPASPSECEGILASIKAIGYRIKAFQVVSVDPFSGRITLKLSPSGDQLGRWLLGFEVRNFPN